MGKGYSVNVGDRYRIRDNDNIQDEFRGRLFTVTKIDTDYYYVLLDDEDRTHHIDKNDWLGLVEDISSWHGNILLHKFI